MHHQGENKLFSRASHRQDELRSPSCVSLRWHSIVALLGGSTMFLAAVFGHQVTTACQAAARARAATLLPIPYVLYPIPYTQCPVPCTLYPIPYTLYPIS